MDEINHPEVCSSACKCSDTSLEKVSEPASTGSPKLKTVSTGSPKLKTVLKIENWQEEGFEPAGRVHH